MPRKANFLKQLEAEQGQKQEIVLYTPHPFQRAIVEDTHRFKVVACGRRFGKTTFAVNELLLAALTHFDTLQKKGITDPKPGVYWYVGPTYKQAQMIAWNMLEHILSTLPPDLVRNKDKTHLTIEFTDLTRIEIKGADNEDSLRGVYVDGVVLDEYAYFKPYVWTRIVRPMLTDHKGWAIFISTPHGYNHFFQLWESMPKENPTEWKSWRFKSTDNPYLPPEEIEAARKDTAPEVFAQEWEADFRMFKGLIYKDFDKETHVKEFDVNPGWTFYHGMDFGTSNPTVCLFIGVDRDDVMHVFDEYFMSGHSIDYHSGMIKAKYPQFEFRATFGDPSALSEHIEYANQQLYVTPANRFFTNDKGTTESWVKAGINMVSTKLRIDPVLKTPKLLVHPRCVNLIKEFQGYEWDELRGFQIDKPKKINDHGMDALRYVICSYGGVPKQREYKYHYVPQNETTGY